MNFYAILPEILTIIIAFYLLAVTKDTYNKTKDKVFKAFTWLIIVFILAQITDLILEFALKTDTNPFGLHNWLTIAFLVALIIRL